jgi:hypothetical protein
MLPILLPLAVGVPPSFVAGLQAMVKPSSTDAETAVIIAGVVAVATYAMVGFQSCAAIARDKQMHTAELLALTPAGGRGMILWKTGAIFLSQSLALALMFMLMMKPIDGGWLSSTSRLAHALDALSLVVLLWAAGISFSVVTRSPFAAAGLLAASIFVAAPALAAVIPTLALFIADNSRREARLMTAECAWVALAVGACVIVFRQLCGRAAAGVLAAGTALFAAAGWLLVMDANLFRTSMVDLLTLPVAMERSLTGVAFRAALAQGALAAVLIVGMQIRFTRALLVGAKPKE